MDPLLIVLRVVHVVGGVFWGGAILFVVHFLEPAVRDAGPDGAKVMQALQKRRYLDVMPVVAALTVVSGYWLYWRVFGRWHPGPGASGAELWLGVGGFARPRRLRDRGEPHAALGAADRPPGRRARPGPAGAERRDRGRGRPAARPDAARRPRGWPPSSASPSSAWPSAATPDEPGDRSVTPTPGPTAASLRRGPVPEPSAPARLRPLPAPLRAGVLLRGGAPRVRGRLDGARVGARAGAVGVPPPRRVEREAPGAAAAPRHGHERRAVLLPRGASPAGRGAGLQLGAADPGPPLQGRLLLDPRPAVVHPQRALLPGPLHLPALRDPHPLRDLVPEGDGDEDRPARLREHRVHLRPAAHHPGRRRRASGAASGSSPTTGAAGASSSPRW